MIPKLGPFGAWLGLCAAGAAAAPEASLLTALRTEVRTLSRPVHVYHYTTRAKLGLDPVGDVAPHDASLRRYLPDRVARYWNLGIPTAPYEMVGGLHVAVDPVVGRIFGGVGDAWALVQMTLPRGFRFLDLRTAGTPDHVPRLPRAVGRRLAAQGCATDQADYLLTTLESAACRKIAVETLVELDVDGVLYDYPGIKYTACPGRPGGAFILLRTQAFDLSAAMVFTADARQDDALPQRVLIREAFLAAQRAGSARPAPWPDLAGQEPRTPFAAWVRERLFGCGGHAEDALPVKHGEEALEQWRELSRGRPACAWSHFHLAEALAALGRTGDAVEEYRRAVEADSEFPEAIQALARIHATSQDPRYRDPAEAVRLATRLVEIVYYRPRSGQAWPKQRMIEASLVLAAADAAAGNLGRAEAYATQALEVAGREHDADANPLIARVAEKARRLLEDYRSRRHAARRP